MKKTIVPLGMLMILLLTSCGSSNGPWPKPRIMSSMFYDPESEKVLLLGGYHQFGGFPDLLDLWTYDTFKNSWEEIGKVDPQDAPLTLGLDEESGVVIALNLFPYNTWAYDISEGT